MTQVRVAGRHSVTAPPDVVVARTATRRHGAVTSAQLADAGLDRGAVRRRVAAGRLHRKYRGVYAVGHAALSQHGRWTAAVLAAGPGAALSHLSAAALWGIWRRAPAGIDVIGRRRRVGPSVRVHECRALDRRDVAKRDGIPVTTVARTLVDLADLLTSYQLANVIHEAAFHKRVDAAATRDAMTRANGRRRLGVLKKALALHEAGSAGTRSALEDRLLALLNANDLPEPLVNVRIDNIEVDCHWPSARLCVETDGDGHTRPRTQSEDRARDEHLRAAGYKVIRVTEDDIEHRPRAILATLRGGDQVTSETAATTKATTSAVTASANTAVTAIATRAT